MLTGHQAQSGGRIEHMLLSLVGRSYGDATANKSLLAHVLFNNKIGDKSVR